MRHVRLAGSILCSSMIAGAAQAQAPATTRDLMGHAQVEAQKKAGADLLRRTEDAGRYQAIAPQAAPSPSLDGIGTRSALQLPRPAAKGLEK